MFPRENLYDRIVLPGKLYNLDHFTGLSEEGILIGNNCDQQALQLCGLDFVFVTESSTL